MSTAAAVQSDTLVATPNPGGLVRPRVSGKFFYAGDEKLYVKGVSYGPSSPAADGAPFPGNARGATSS